MGTSIGQMIKPGRQPGESFADYRKRRAGANRAVKKWLKGRFIWTANKIVDIKLDDKGAVVLPGTPEYAMSNRSIPVKKPVDGTYSWSKHGPIGTPAHKFTAHKKAWGQS